MTPHLAPSPSTRTAQDQREALVRPLAALILTIALIYTLGYPISLTWELARYFAFGQLHSLVFAGNAGLLLLVLHWMAQRPVLPRHYRLAGAMLVIAHSFTVITAVFWVPAYTPDHQVLHLGMLTYVLILLLGHFSLLVTVPWWTWSRLQLLRLIADTLLTMSLIDIGLTMLLPALVPGWVWTPALTAAVFRLETSMGLAFWYQRVYRRFGAFRHPSLRYWALGLACMIATDAALLWGTLRMEQGATDLLLGAAMPFWMVHQTLWALGLHQVLAALPPWRTTPIVGPARNPTLRWILALRQGAALAVLAVIASSAGSLRATIWFVTALIMSQIVGVYTLMLEHDELGQAHRKAAALNARLETAQRQLVALNRDLVAANTQLRDLGQQQGQLLEQRQIRAAEVAHDMGNLLQDVQLALALIEETLRRRQITPPPALTEALAGAAATMGAIDDLLAAMVAAARLDAGALQLDLAPHDPLALLQRVVQQQRARARQLNVALTLEPAAGARPIHGDAALLTRALHNLVANALKYTAAVRRDGSGLVQVGVEPAGEQVQIWVRDNGPGIAPEQLAQLGQPFVRGPGAMRAAAGFGLGLAFTRGIVEQHPGGALTITSAPGAGTTVMMTLPAAQAPVERERTVGGEVGS